MMKMVLSALVTASFVVACSKSETKSTGDKSQSPATGDRIAISVTEKGFEPENVSVPSGKPVTLVFTRKTDTTCAKEVVIPLDGKKIEKPLPLNEPVAIAVTFPKAGQITYACGMDMVKGVVVVQ
jgi:plastocyanin domain-containing protein